MIAEVAPATQDADVVARAFASGAILLTADKDFGELVFRQNSRHCGVVLLRLEGLAPSEKATVTVEAFRVAGEALRDAFSVLNPKQLRVRPSRPRGRIFGAAKSLGTGLPAEAFAPLSDDEAGEWK